MFKPFSQFTKTVLQSSCSDKTYERGFQYLKNDHVRKIWLEDNKLYANVLGSYDNYKVLIEDNESRFTYHCTCPFEGDCCKHVVAAGLAFLTGQDKLIKQATQTQSSHTDLKQQLSTLPKENIIDLLLLSLKTHHNWKNTFFKELGKQLEKQGGSEIKDLYKKQFETHLERVCTILEEHNRYGGGPEEEEDEVFETLDDIVQLFKENKLSLELKHEFIERMFHYYDWENSGMNDMVWDALYDVCNSQKDWLYLIEKLQRKDSEYRKELVMQIYKDKLNDEEAYLRMRQHDLQYGSDYYDLVLFYKNKGNIEMALTIAKQGAERGEGRIVDLLEFLFEHYKSKDYPAALLYLKKIFAEEAGTEMYKRLKQFAHSDDWASLDTWCRTVLKKQRKTNQLARIQLDNKEYDHVLEYVLEKPSNVFFTYDFSEKESFAKQLIPFYPEKLLPFYMQKINWCLEQMGRDNYKKAAHYTQFVKDIYTRYLHKEDLWKSFIENIRKTYEKRPALLEEFKGL